MANPILGRDMAVDLGTSTTRVHLRGKGVTASVPSKVAGHTPILDGVIADFDSCVDLLRRQIHGGQRRRLMGGPKLALAVPALTTAVERRALTEAGYEAGARQVDLLDAPLMAAIAAGLPVHRETGTMIVTMGAGLTEISLIQLGAVAASYSARINGVDLDHAIAAAFRARHGVVLDPATAEDLKLELGSAWPLGESDSIELAAPDAAGAPKTVSVTGAEVRQALTEPIGDIVDAVRTALETHPDLAADIGNHGIVIAGAAAQLRGLDELLSHELEIPVYLAPQPELAVVIGAGRCIDSPALMRSVLGAERRIA